MGDITALEIVGAAAAAVVAFFISLAGGQRTKIAARVSLLVSLGLVVADRGLWVVTGDGLVDQMTCAAFPQGVNCKAKTGAPPSTHQPVTPVGTTSSRPVPSSVGSPPPTLAKPPDASPASPLPRQSAPNEIVGTPARAAEPNLQATADYAATYRSTVEARRAFAAAIEDHPSPKQDPGALRILNASGRPPGAIRAGAYSCGVYSGIVSDNYGSRTITGRTAEFYKSGTFACQFTQAGDQLFISKTNGDQRFREKVALSHDGNLGFTSGFLWMSGERFLWVIDRLADGRLRAVRHQPSRDEPDVLILAPL